MSTRTPFGAGLIVLLVLTIAIGIAVNVDRRSYPVKFGLAVVIFALTCAVSAPLFRRSRPRLRLTRGETRMRELVREVYGANITGEQVVRSGSGRVLVVRLQNEAVEQLQINLTSLARKHKPGASIAALKTAVRL